MRIKQKVVWGNTKSKIGEINAGVPQDTYTDDATFFIDFDNEWRDREELFNNDPKHMTEEQATLINQQ